MKNLIALFSVIFLVFGCAGGYNDDDIGGAGGDINAAQTPTVNYIQHLDPHGASHNDPFLAQLTVNYRSFAIYNAQVAGLPDLGEFFAQKGLAAFSGQIPMPENLDNWNIVDSGDLFELRNACNELLTALQNDAAVETPRLAGEAQGKFDCWVSATASGMRDTAAECRRRFENTMLAISGNGGIIDENQLFDHTPLPPPTSGFAQRDDMPSTADLMFLTDTRRTRQGVVVVNNINVPANLIRPAPVHPVVFNQYIGGGPGRSRGPGGGGGGAMGSVGATDGESDDAIGAETVDAIGGETVSRDEFINMMMALRSEIMEINKRLDAKTDGTVSKDSTMIHARMIPTEPKQRIMEEIFEVKFDFNKAEIRPEFTDVIKQLAETARNNSNVKISIVGHTDTVGSDTFNFGLGGRRAATVRDMLIKHGIPASSIIILSAGKNDLKVQTGANVKNADNRRARVVKEIRYMENSNTAQYGTLTPAEKTDVQGLQEEVLQMPSPVK